jgi:AraC family transcriptional regulator, transcriptional activator FtrA
VAVLVADGLSPFEFAVACEVFGYDRAEPGVAWYRMLVVAPAPGLVRTDMGFRIEAKHGLRALSGAHTIVVCPATGAEAMSEPVLAALRRAHRRGARVMSLCTGAFTLAAAGLLDGRRATTHWAHATQLAAQYPRIEVDPGVLYVDGGTVLTSAGSAASVDLCLHVVRLDFGAEVAATTARRMVVPPHRDGGQAQFIDQPFADTADMGAERFTDSLTWALEHLDEPMSVEDLARRSAMSPRTFARRFRAATGTTPHRWIVRQRVLLAQRLLETSDTPVDLVASRSGFGTTTNLRYHFQREVRTGPSAYRRTFQVRPEADADGGQLRSVPTTETKETISPG